MQWKILPAIFLAIVCGCSPKATTSTSDGIVRLTQPQPIILHMVVSYSPDKRIERMFLTEQQALDYIDTYKASHDYFYEARTISPDGL